MIKKMKSSSSGLLWYLIKMGYMDPLILKFCAMFERMLVIHKSFFILFFEKRQWRHFNFFLGGAKIFFIFLMPPDYWKIGKNSTLYVIIWLYLYFPSFFFLLFFSFFLFFLFFFLFFFFSFSLGGRRPPPAPLKWRLWKTWQNCGTVLNYKIETSFFVVDEVQL